MKKLFRKFGFTLMEVNLAIFIMAAGVLAMVSLYSLSYRESRQSQDDVKGATAADAVLNEITAALSSRNITWQEWKSAVNSAVNVTGDTRGSGGWMAYCNKQNNTYSPKKRSEINVMSRRVFNALVGAYDGGASWPNISSDLACALVVQWGMKSVMTNPGGGKKAAVVEQQRDYSRVAISFRCTKNADALFAAPIYYTEVHFQGDQEALR